MPLNEIIYDFFDTLKSRTKGYTSFDYEYIGYKNWTLLSLIYFLGGEAVDVLFLPLFIGIRHMPKEQGNSTEIEGGYPKAAV